jgi:hypothetical protein
VHTESGVRVKFEWSARRQMQVAGYRPPSGTGQVAFDWNSNRDEIQEMCGYLYSLRVVPFTRMDRCSNRTTDVGLSLTQQLPRLMDARRFAPAHPT